MPLAWAEVERQEGQRDWSLSDRQIEWCRSKGLKICAGPLVQLDRLATPDWLYLWEGDDEHLASFVSNYLREAVTLPGQSARLAMRGTPEYAGSLLVV